jgi:hypothetical protein
VIGAIRVMEKLNPRFVDATISDLAIKPQFQAVAKEARIKAAQLLRAAST